MLNESQFTEIQGKHNLNQEMLEKGVIQGFKPTYVIKKAFKHKRVRVFHNNQPAEIQIAKIIKKFKGMNMSIIDNQLIFSDYNRKITINIDKIEVIKDDKTSNKQ